LCFVATDAAIGKLPLQRALSAAVEDSFNRITIDGDMSTNDTVLLLANGVSGITWQSSDEGFRKAFADALLKICEHLAYLIVGDGEKISKVVTLQIFGAANEEDARKVGYAIGHSALVKSSWAGSDPNWGRVLCAVGYSGVPVVEQHLSMHYDEIPVVVKGQPVDENLSKWKSIVARKQFTIRVDLAMGDAETRLIASDLTPEYITFNMKE
jgi:glutamate N-acetyltransferase / amino-acid N-acetyltransferase